MDNLNIESRDNYHPVDPTPNRVINAPEDIWEDLGQQELHAALNVQRREKRAKNVILFIGDGMGVSTITAARWLKLQETGAATMDDARLSFERFEHMGSSMVRISHLVRR